MYSTVNKDVSLLSHTLQSKGLPSVINTQKLLKATNARYV